MSLNQFSASLSKWKILLLGKDLKSNIIRDGMGSLLLRAGFILLSFGTTIALTRTMGPDGYGVYTFVIALVSLVSIPAEFGLPNLVVRETAWAFAKKEWGMMQGVWHWASKITAFIAFTLIVIGVLVVIFLGDEYFSSDELRTMYWGIALLPLVALGNLRGAALRGLKKVVLGQLPEQLILPGIFILLVLYVPFIFSIENFTPTLAMALRFLAASLAFGVGAWFLWRNTPLEIHSSDPIYESRRWLISTLPLAFLSGMLIINNRISIAVLGFFTNSFDVGIYRVAEQMAMLVSASLQAINMVVAPRIAHFFIVKDKERLQKLSTTGASIAFLITLPIAMVFLLFGRVILNIFFDAEFLISYDPMRILVIGHLINSVTGSAGFLLNMTGHEKDTARILTIAAVGNVVLNLVLVPLFGTLGAALSSMISIALWNILLWLAARRRLKINSLAFNLFPIKKFN